MNKSANEANPLKFTNFIKIMKLTLFFLFFSILLSQATIPGIKNINTGNNLK
jgi:hypothetical protein